MGLDFLRLQRQLQRVLHATAKRPRRAASNANGTRSGHVEFRNDSIAVDHLTEPADRWHIA